MKCITVETKLVQCDNEFMFSMHITRQKKFDSFRFNPRNCPIKVFSNSYPALEGRNDIYIRGADTSRDDTVATIRFDNEARARRYVKDFFTSLLKFDKNYRTSEDVEEKSSIDLLGNKIEFNSSEQEFLFS